jgi:staphyloferrin A synthase
MLGKGMRLPRILAAKCGQSSNFPPRSQRDGGRAPASLDVAAIDNASVRGWRVADRGGAGTVTSPAGSVRTPDPVERATAAALDRIRPDLTGPYTEALPGARAAVLGRLWGALAREPIAGISGVTRHGGDLVVRLADGRRLHGPAAPARPFAAAPDRLTLTLDGSGYDQPAALLDALRLPGHAERLRAELADSVANLALARAAQPPPDAGPPALTRLDPAGAEQLVVDGHPLHPCCRTRLGMSTAEILAYAPEHRPLVRLEYVDVPPDRWVSTGAGLPPRLLVHPWQREHVLDRYPGLRPTGDTVPARPLMSLRTLALADGHVKTAIDVQMTSAVRTVSAAAIHNGPLLSGLLAGTGLIDLLVETAAGAVLVDGAPCRSLAMVRRDAPRVAPGEVVLPLAALAARSPADGRPLAVEAITIGYAGSPAGFFADLVNLLFPPLTALLHLGVALEAHGQNMCLALRGGRPVRLLYRDLGGVRVSPRRLAAAGLPAPPVRGDLASDDPRVLRTKPTAALLSSVVTEVVTLLAGEYAEPPATLWTLADRALARAYDALPAATRADGEALRADPWPIKATTAMRLADDPLDDQWTWLDNPLRERS